MIRINLISLEEQKEIKGLRNFILGVLIIIAVLVSITTIHLFQSESLMDVKNKTAKAEKRIKELEEIKKKVEEFKVKNKELERRIKLIAQLEENRTGPLFVMDSMSDAIPERAWVDKFTEKGFRAKLEGIAWNEFTVSDFMRQLQSSNYFTNVELKSIKKKNLQKLPLRSFVIESKLNYSGKTKKKTESKEKNSEDKNKAEL
ncbi:MAG: PilN domain-containing protein [Thermodesulfobacteriota bacterium]